MTLRRYTPEMLDQLALRLYDIGGCVRKMSEELRRNEMADAEVHDKKVHEWCEKLEFWCAKTAAQMAAQVRLKARARVSS